MKPEQVTQTKTSPKKNGLTFGDFVAGIYQTCGSRKAKGIVQLAVELHLVEFRGAKRFMIS
ncbi:MAG TPA: hypothetical protein VGR14_01155 [Verrucomicrobiae bacterium]|jgi:hypothetical protein|nr:hypothetical protein [Verrucomicrobiae bacterium]